MVDLLSNKQFQKIVATIKKKKLTFLITSYKKQNRKNFHETKYQTIKKQEKRIIDIKKREKPIK